MEMNVDYIRAKMEIEHSQGELLFDYCVCFGAFIYSIIETLFAAANHLPYAAGFYFFVGALTLYVLPPIFQHDKDRAIIRALVPQIEFD